jgi:hypothetical protein
MSSFVHPENQRIIWNIVNKNIYVNDFFQINTHVSKEQWFRSIIEKFYMQNEGRNLSIDELNMLNKDVLTFMVKSIHSIPPQNKPQDTPPVIASTPAPTPITNYQIQTPPYVPNNIGEQTNREFEHKKQEYEGMYARQKPDEMDFKEKHDDSIIENMDELINNHISEREKQIKELHPPILTNVNPATPMPTMTHVDPATSMPTMTHVDPATPMPNGKNTDKITFTIQENKEIQTSDSGDDTQMKMEILELKEKVKQLHEDYSLFKTDLETKYNGHASAIEKIQLDVATIQTNANNFDQQSDKSD